MKTSLHSSPFLVGKDNIEHGGGRMNGTNGLRLLAEQLSCGSHFDSFLSKLQRIEQLIALHRPILRMSIDRGTVAPVEYLAVKLRWAVPKLFQR